MGEYFKNVAANRVTDRLCGTCRRRKDCEDFCRTWKSEYEYEIDKIEIEEEESR